MEIKNLIVGIFALVGSIASAQMPHDSQLYKEMKKADSLLFETGFNQCDFKVLEKLIHKDLLFLHDQGGIQNREQFLAAMRQNICPQSGPKPIRKLVEGSFEVYPLYDKGKLYGAIQTGLHKFYISEKGKPLQVTGIAKFSDTWLLENGEWKLYHVLSYDHQPANE